MSTSLRLFLIAAICKFSVHAEDCTPAYRAGSTDRCEQICKLPGYNICESSYKESAAATTVDACASLCKDEPICKRFSFGSGSGCRYSDTDINQDGAKECPTVGDTASTDHVYNFKINDACRAQLAYTEMKEKGWHPPADGSCCAGVDTCANGCANYLLSNAGNNQASGCQGCYELNECDPVFITLARAYISRTYGCGPGSTCVDLFNSYACVCEPGFEGGGLNTGCTNINDCAGVDCGGSSTCVDGLDEYTCNCASGYEGGGDNAVCTDINECEKIDCGGSSTCVNGLDKYTCNCASGYEGGGDNAVCTVNVDNCDGVDCGGEGSSCVDGSYKYTCTCGIGYMIEKDGGGFDFISVLEQIQRGKRVQDGYCDFHYKDLGSEISSAQGCADACRAEPQCKIFTYGPTLRCRYSFDDQQCAINNDSKYPNHKVYEITNPKAIDNSVCTSNNAKLCNDAGIAQAGGSCVCDPNTAGPACEFSDSKTCSDAGVARADGSCDCYDSAGPSCEYNNAKLCNDAGIAQAGGSCACNPNTAGPACEFSDSKTCNGAGVASKYGTCYCKDDVISQEEFVFSVEAGATSLEVPGAARPLVGDYVALSDPVNYLIWESVKVVKITNTTVTGVTTGILTLAAPVANSYNPGTLVVVAPTTTAIGVGPACEWSNSKTCNDGGVVKLWHGGPSDSKCPGSPYWYPDGSCVCNPNTVGEFCEFSDSKTCNGAGAAYYDGSCRCDPNTAGPACEFSNAKTCSGAGEAKADGTCDCTNPATNVADPAVGVGPACEFSNSKTCNDAGTALATGKCECNPGIQGANCLGKTVKVETLQITIKADVDLSTLNAADFKKFADSGKEMAKAAGVPEDQIAEIKFVQEIINADGSSKDPKQFKKIEAPTSRRARRGVLYGAITFEIIFKDTATVDVTTLLKKVNDEIGKGVKFSVVLSSGTLTGKVQKAEVVVVEVKVVEVKVENNDTGVVKLAPVSSASTTSFAAVLIAMLAATATIV